MGISYLLLLILFSRQTEHSRTASGISRVSLWTFLIQATMDSVSFAGHITFAILAEGRPSLSLIVPAFLACLVFVHEAVRKVFPFLVLVIDPSEYSNSPSSFIKYKDPKIIRHLPYLLLHSRLQQPSATYNHHFYQLAIHRHLRHLPPLQHRR